MKTYFASTLLATATIAFDFNFEDAKKSYYETTKNSDYYGDYGYKWGHFGPRYTGYPAAPKPENRDEKYRDVHDANYPEATSEVLNAVSTDDDRYSSSNSDSLSSSDEGHPESVTSTDCSQSGDEFRCKRAHFASECNFFQAFDPNLCLCTETIQCNVLKGDGYGNNCPSHKPHIDPLHNCRCISDSELEELQTPYANHCKKIPYFEPKPFKRPELVFCNSQTDSDSDCVRVGNKHFRIDVRDRVGNFIDDNGNEDSSIYVDSNCDPRYSSCDTNSNEEFSNTDTAGTFEETSAITLSKGPLIKGSLAAFFGKRYGVTLPSDTEESDHHYGYHEDSYDG